MGTNEHLLTKWKQNDAANFQHPDIHVSHCISKMSPTSKSAKQQTTGANSPQPSTGSETKQTLLLYTLTLVTWVWGAVEEQNADFYNLMDAHHIGTALRQELYLGPKAPLC